MKSALLLSIPAMLAASDNLIPGFDWGAISATALLGWYLWYTTKVVFPNHRKEVSEMQENFTEQFLSQRGHYEKLLNGLQTRHDARHEQIVDALKKIKDCFQKQSDDAS
jgi:hypothetical protein